MTDESCERDSDSWRTFTSELPTEPGWYWLSYPDGYNPVTVEVIKSAHTGDLVVSSVCGVGDIRDPVYKMAMWAGPIPEPIV